MNKQEMAHTVFDAIHLVENRKLTDSDFLELLELPDVVLFDMTAAYKIEMRKFLNK